jgi:hypothetical protein
MVAENYLRVKDLTIRKTAETADAISLGDALPRLEEDMALLYQVVLPCSFGSGSLSSRPSYPVLPAKTAAIVNNRRKLPCSYDLLQAVENRIVKTLEKAPAAAVAREMKSLNMFGMTDWEVVHNLAPVGRQPVQVSPSKKDELLLCLTKK